MPNPLAQSPSVTRLGPIHVPSPTFPKDDRFRAQTPSSLCDVIYSLPSVRMTRQITFPSTERDGTGDASNSGNGPGSYVYGDCFNHLSEKTSHHAGRFPRSQRQSMAMRTPSPGAIYNLGNTYWNGPVKTLPVRFNRDQRPAMNQESLTANADMLWPSLPRTPSVTIASRIPRRLQMGAGPGKIYDIKVRSASPSYSFGRGQTARFSPVNFLPEMD